jgi:hypothetical protein
MMTPVTEETNVLVINFRDLKLQTHFLWLLQYLTVPMVNERSYWQVATVPVLRPKSVMPIGSSVRGPLYVSIQGIMTREEGALGKPCFYVAVYNKGGKQKVSVLVPGRLVPGNPYNLWISIGVNDKYMDTFESQNSIIGLESV